jgi:hypothetical protein
MVSGMEMCIGSSSKEVPGSAAEGAEHSSGSKIRDGVNEACEGNGWTTWPLSAAMSSGVPTQQMVLQVVFEQFLCSPTNAAQGRWSFTQANKGAEKTVLNIRIWPPTHISRPLSRPPDSELFALCTFAAFRTV